MISAAWRQQTCCTKNRIRLMGCRHSWVDSSAPSILPPWVQVPRKHTHLRFYQYLFGLSHVEKTKIKKRPEIAHFLKKNKVNAVQMWILCYYDKYFIDITWEAISVEVSEQCCQIWRNFAHCCEHFKILGNFLSVSFIFGKIVNLFGPFLWYWTNAHCCIWPNIE